MALTTEDLLHKADFGDIYDQPDPRPYFGTLRPFDYVIPQHGAEVYRLLLAARAAQDGRPLNVLDVCCSYGVVAMLLKTELHIRDLYAHYAKAADRSLSVQQLAEHDQRVLRDGWVPGAPHVVGLDVAGNAVDYAVATGALDAGFTENLEVDEPSPEFATQGRDIDLVVTTGGVGYVTDRTFDRLLNITPASVWVASFCLRTYDYAPISETLKARGFSTERSSNTFSQRRFTGPEEQEWAVGEVQARGLGPAGRESDGSYYADFFLSRPTAEVDACPLSELVPELA